MQCRGLTGGQQCYECDPNVCLRHLQVPCGPRNGVTYPVLQGSDDPKGKGTSNGTLGGIEPRRTEGTQLDALAIATGVTAVFPAHWDSCASLPSSAAAFVHYPPALGADWLPGVHLLPLTSVLYTLTYLFCA